MLRLSASFIFCLISLPSFANLTIGLVATRSEAETLSHWQPVLDDMEKSLGTPVKALAFNKYDDLLQAIKNGDVQIARLGSRLAMEAIESSNTEIFARLVLAGGVETYRSVLLAQKDSKFQNLTDVLRESGRLRYAGGKASSTSGFLIPQYYAFLKNNILYEQHFKSLSVGSHQDNFLALAQKKIDIATNNTDDLAQLKKKYPKEYSQVKVIWESPPVTFDPIIQRRDLSPELKQKIAAFFLNYGKTGGNIVEQKRKLNEADQLDGFLPSSNAQLRPVSDLQLFHDRFRLSLNTKVSDAEKFSQEKAMYQRYEKLAKILARWYCRE